MSVSTKITANSQEIDTSPEAWGELRDSSALAFDGPALREQMEEDGYLYMPGLLNRPEVLEARAFVAQRLYNAGALQEGSDPMDCIAREGFHSTFMPDLARRNPALEKVIYAGPMMEFWERFFSEPVRHFDYTWFRAVAPGHGTPAHCDSVYMNRGTLDLYTAWTPIGDITREVGGLMVLEGSHKIDRLRQNYGMKDVDKFCSNRVGEDFDGMGGGGNIQPGGVLSSNAARLRQNLGGRWLSTEFRAGDLLCFSIFTVHASCDNRSNQIRLSSDSRYQKASEPADERWIGPSPIAHGPKAKRGMIC